MRALLAAIWQSDAAFPSGGFAFSNGVEAAAATLREFRPRDARRADQRALGRRWASAERPAMLHAFHAADFARLGAVDAAYEAATLLRAVAAWLAPRRPRFPRPRIGGLAPRARTIFEQEIAASRAFGHLGRRAGVDLAPPRSREAKRRRLGLYDSLGHGAMPPCGSARSARWRRRPRLARLAGY